MHDFQFIKNKLCCENVPVSKIIEKTSTPAYIYSKKTLLDHYRKIDTAFRDIQHIICYSVKSNSNVAICKTLIEAGAGLDIVSGGELFRAEKAGANPKKVVFAGVGKTEEEIRHALKFGILFFSVESIPELHRINQVAKSLKVKAPFALRVNPDVDPHTHGYIATGKKGTKFGMDIDTCKWLYKQHTKFPHTIPIGIQIHIGSQITTPHPYVDALTKITPIVNELKNMIPSVKYLDIGGGLGIVYEKEKPQTAAEFANAVLPLLKNLGLTIILEPGRFIAGNAGILVTQVQYIKQSQYKNFIIVDSGMNDLIRPSLYSAHHEIVPVTRNKGKTISADIVGPICESGDFFALNRKIETLKQGDLLAIMGAGAYGFSMSSNYNSRRRAVEVLVNKNKFSIIRTRETYEDIIKNEKY
jgi:diaminopimelate decarboxylase